MIHQQQINNNPTVPVSPARCYLYIQTNESIYNNLVGIHDDGCMYVKEEEELV
jgi:hypothetical protein